MYLLVYTKELLLNIGISVPLLTYKVDVVFMARQAEALGFESFWHTGTYHASAQQSLRSSCVKKHEAKESTTWIALWHC